MIYDWDTMLPERAFKTTGFGTRLMTLEGGGKGARPPDYTPLKEAMLQVGDDMKALGMEQLRFAKQRYSDTLPMFEAQAQADIRSRAIADSLANQLLQERAKFQAVESQLASDIMRDDERIQRDYYAGLASADVQQSFDAQKKQNARNLQRLGISPDSPKFAQINSNFAVQASKANVGARNMARRQAMQDQFGRKVQMANIGRNIPSQATSILGQGSALGRSSGSNLMGANSTMFQGYGGAMQGLGGQMRAIGGAGNLMSQDYANQMAYAQSQNQMMQGFGQLAGLGAGLYFGAEGGKLVGEGTGTSDSIKGINTDTGDTVMVSNGEFVTKASSSKKMGYDVMSAINDGTITRKDIKPQALKRAKKQPVKQVKKA
jgi:hypothetical protein